MISVDHHRLFGDQPQMSALMHIEPSLVPFFLLIQKLFDPLFIFRIKLPVKNRQISIIQLIGWVAQNILIKHNSLILDGMFLFIKVILDKIFTQMIGSQVEHP